MSYLEKSFKLNMKLKKNFWTDLLEQDILFLPNPWSRDDCIPAENWLKPKRKKKKKKEGGPWSTLTKNGNIC